MTFKKASQYVALCLLLLIASLGAYLYYQHEKRFPSTDDAYIQAHIINIAPQVSGTLSKIFIENNQWVKKGDPLLYIDPQPFLLSQQQAQANLNNTRQQVKRLEAAVATAKAQLEQRQAELTQVQQATQRTLALVKRQWYPAAAGDEAIQNVKVAKAALTAAQSQLAEAQEQLGQPGEQNAQVQAALAALKQASLQLQYTRLFAPTSGHVAQLTVRPGSELTTYQTLFAIIDDSKRWVSANFKETDLTDIRPGQRATITVDMYPSHPFTGQVVSVSAGSGASFALLPPEEATGNWIKVTQRFPVRIAIPDLDPRYPLRVGASCRVVVDTQAISGEHLSH